MRSHLAHTTALPQGLPRRDYPRHQLWAPWSSPQKKINLSTVFAGQAVGIEEGIWLVSFMEQDLGYIDLEGTNGFQDG